MFRQVSDGLSEHHPLLGRRQPGPVGRRRRAPTRFACLPDELFCDEASVVE